MCKREVEQRFVGFLDTPINMLEHSFKPLQDAGSLKHFLATKIMRAGHTAHQQAEQPAGTNAGQPEAEQGQGGGPHALHPRQRPQPPMAVKLNANDTKIR